MGKNICHGEKPLKMPTKKIEYTTVLSKDILNRVYSWAFSKLGWVDGPQETFLVPKPLFLRQVFIVCSRCFKSSVTPRSQGAQQSQSKTRAADPGCECPSLAYPH